MQDIERIAIFTMIDGIEHQLRGVKALLTAGTNLGAPPVKHTVHGGHTESQYATGEEEDRIAETLENVRKAETARIAQAAAAAHSGIWAETAGEQQ